MTFKELHGKFALLEKRVIKLQKDARRGKQRQKRADTKVERLTAAIRWALGEDGEFGEEPPPLAGKCRRRYWWRTELRQRAGLDVSPDPIVADEGAQR